MAIKWDKPTITVAELRNILFEQYGPECNTRILMEDQTKPMPYKASVVACECLRCGKQFSMTPYALCNAIYLNGYICTTCGNLSDDEVKAQKKEHMRVKTIETLKEHGIDILKEEFGKKEEHPENPMEDEYSSSAGENELGNDYDLEETDDTEIVESTESAIPETQEETVSEPDSEEIDVSAYMASDKDYSEPIGEIVNATTEVTEDEDIPEDTGDDAADEYVTDEEESVVEESEAKETSAEEPTTEESISEDDVFGVEEPAAKPEEENVEEKTVTEEQPEDNMIWVNNEPYTQDELSAAFNKAVGIIQRDLHYVPFDLDTCEIQDNKIWITCKECGERVSFDSFEDLASIESLEAVLSRYGKSIPKGKINNYKKLIPMVSKCSVCLKSVIDNGFNKYHKNRVLEFCEKAHIEILEPEKHLWINDNNESFLVKVNNIKKVMRWGEILYKFTDREHDSVLDARLDPLFAITEPKPIKSAEFVKPAVTTEKVKIEERTKIIPDVVTPANKVAATAAFEQNTVEQPKRPEPIVLHPKSIDDYKKEAEDKQEIPVTHSTMSEKKKPVFSFSNNANKGSMFTSDKVTDSMYGMEADRIRQEHETQKKNVFHLGQKFKTGRKDIARLNGKINPFEREVSLKQEFEETVFFEFIEMLSEKTGVAYKLVLNETTYEIPVVDFESGLRLICSNLKESDLVNARYEWINPRVPFSFFNPVAENDGTGVLKKKRMKYKWDVLFSDSVEYARDATFAALVKYINPQILAYEGKKVVLQDNLIFQYTKHNQYLRDFDKRNSTFPSRKPNTGSLGIIARWNSSSQATAKDVLKFKLQMESAGGNVANLDTLANNYNEYMVASIKYIEQFNKETNRVIYTITEYVEVGSAIIADGFAQCLRALLKEYIRKFPQLTGIDPFVVVEVDPSTFPSPSLYSYVERGTLCKVDNAFKGIMTGQMNTNQGVDRTYRFSYVRRPEYRRNVDIDNMRQDRRMFTTGSLITRMSEEIKQAGLSNTIRNPEVKKQFIANMGYVEATQPETALYFVNRSVLATLMVDGYTMSLQEHIDETNFNATKMVNDSTVGIGVNNVMMNPNLMMKYQNIMQSGSAEAKDLFNRMVQEDYQQKMMEMMMSSQGQGQAQATMNPQNFNPMMGMGMNPMMGGMGMNMNPMGMPMGMPMMPGMGF